MANYSVSFIFLFFPECFQTVIYNTEKKQYSTCPDLINREKLLSLPINIYSLVYLNKESTQNGKFKNGKKSCVLSSEILETETSKSEKKMLHTEKLAILQFLI